MAQKPLEIDMCAGSELRDTQGEMLSVAGADITDLQNGRGRINDNHGSGFFNSVGRVTSAKKIFKSEDCENDRQRYYWNIVKSPYIYVKAVLYNNEDHPNAKAAAAILRNIYKADVPLKLKASVEGGVVSRGMKDRAYLERTKIHSVALTFVPANQATLVEPINLDKSEFDEAADMQLIKSVVHLAQTDVPSFRHVERDASASKIIDNLQSVADVLVEAGLYKNIEVASKEEIIKGAIESKVASNIEKIQELLKEAKEDELEKGIKQIAAGAAMLGALAGSPAGAEERGTRPAMMPKPKVSLQQPKLDLANPPEEHQKIYKEVSSKYPLLGAIGQVESSGGKNYNHKTIQHPESAWAGHTAAGMFGMMPAAAAYILKNDPGLQKKYPKLHELSQDINKNHKAITEHLNLDPKAAAEFATSLYKRLKSKTTSPEMLAHSWNHGLKGTWNRFKNEGEGAIKSADYVTAVKKAYAGMKPNSKLAKALTAGYGGSGSPTNLSGGGVMQKESLDRNFKYINCDKCGKEQIYSKHQVKCRNNECGKSFSLSTLHKFISGR